MEQTKSFTFKMVGMKFRHSKTVLTEGDIVNLTHVSDNEYDPFAVEVRDDSSNTLGFVGKDNKYKDLMVAMSKTKANVIKVGYYKEGDEKLWDEVEIGDIVFMFLEMQVPVEPRGESRITIGGTPILFDKISHSYSEVETGKNITGVSEFYGNYVEDPDMSFIANNIEKKYDFPAGTMQAAWDDKRDVAGAMGDYIHSILENYYRHTLAGTFVSKSNPVRANEPSDPLSLSLLKGYTDAFGEPDEGVDYLPEISVHTFGLCGTMDLVELKNDKFVIIDYKTNSHSFSKPVTWLPPLKGVVQSNTLGKYEAQLNIYRQMVEHVTSKECAGVFIRYPELPASNWKQIEVKEINILKLIKEYK